MQNVSATLKGKRRRSAPRLNILFAREASTAVVFRRGPSSWVQLVQWNTSNDSFELGQWFHGRLYERRSDISPDGSLLIYFAQKINGRTLQDSEYTYAWTAISKPPYLTALALWPKGDCWHGGGSFQANRVVELNHKQNVARAHPKHEPKGLEVRLRNHVHGEDEPLYSERLSRDGWREQQVWDVEYLGYPDMFHTIKPDIREKWNSKEDMAIRLTRSINELDYSEDFFLIDQQRSLITNIERASWVDWDQQGRLVIAKNGKISIGSVELSGAITENVLIDFCDSKPRPVESPEWAKTWE